MVTSTDGYAMREKIVALPTSKFAKEVRDGFVINAIYLEQRYFWSKGWQDGEKEADDDIKKGRVNNFKNAKDTIKHLRSKRK